MTRFRFAALGAALAYFFDPQNGASRRIAARERLAAIARRRRERRDAPDLTDDLAGKIQDTHDVGTAQPVAGE